MRQPDLFLRLTSSSSSCCSAVSQPLIYTPLELLEVCGVVEGCDLHQLVPEATVPRQKGTKVTLLPDERYSQCEVVVPLGGGTGGVGLFHAGPASHPKGCVELPILADLSSESSQKPAPCVYLEATLGMQAKSAEPHLLQNYLCCG
ncbi:hypothetical protein O3P69_018114 [Scylla paramamosain]|uniref:Uncharacterized protein n=1 Tax=Scylla paramamosain TaxID=85552 RepID=A0AAW0TLP8_SCYPA